MRLMYGLTESQFSSYVETALKNRVNPTESLFQALESRLDSVIYRMGLAQSRRMARQLASHGHFTVNGKRMTVPSYRVRPTDRIAVREGSRGSALFANAHERLAEYRSPSWVIFNTETFEGGLKSLPANAGEGVGMDVQAVFEYYTR